jgi:hypothetical protein
LPGLALAVCHVDSVEVFGVRLDPAAMDFDLAILDLRSKPSADHWRYPVTMHIPIRPDVPQEPSSLRERQGTPDFLRERTKRLDHSAPVAARSVRGFHLVAN